MTTRAARDVDVFKEVTSILDKWYHIPDERGFGGTGAPGRMLEALLKIESNNQDLPDMGRWEIKYTSDMSYLTLFHKDPYPRDPCIVEEMVRACGWPDKNGRTSFRHTIKGESTRGFRVVVDGKEVAIVNERYANLVPRWPRDDLANSAVPKLRNLLLVFGEKRNKCGVRQVKFKIVHAYSRFRFSEFLKGLQEGWVYVDFDARTTPSGGIRNHGTKFRIRTEDMALLYAEATRIDSKKKEAIPGPPRRTVPDLRHRSETLDTGHDIEMSGVVTRTKHADV